MSIATAVKSLLVSFTVQVPCIYGIRDEGLVNVGKVIVSAQAAMIGRVNGPITSSTESIV